MDEKWVRSTVREPGNRLVGSHTEKSKTQLSKTDESKTTMRQTCETGDQGSRK